MVAAVKDHLKVPKAQANRADEMNYKSVKIILGFAGVG